MPQDSAPDSPDPATAPRGDADARHIYQACLDRIDRAFWARRWEALGPLFDMPHRLSGPDNDRVVSDPVQFLELLESARDNFEVAGATEYHRICTTARFESPEQISGSHVTYILRGATPLMPRHTGRAVFVRRDGAWRSVALHAEKPESKLPLFHADRVPLRRL